MLKLVYSEIGNPISDFELEKEYQKILVFKDRQGTLLCLYSTDNIFTRVRLGIVSGDLDCESVRFSFNDKDIVINRFGAIVDWPKGFCDSIQRMAESILRKAMEKRRSDPVYQRVWSTPHD